MTIHFVDKNPEVIDAISKRFNNIPGLVFETGNILSVARDAVVLPSNSYGFMDGGIEQQYMEYFGEKASDIIKRFINKNGGFVPVGSSFVIKTGDGRIPYLIYVPSMELPGAVPKTNCYFTMSAILNEIANSKGKFSEVFCTGLCTGIGSVDYKDAANEMFEAYSYWIRSNKVSVKL